MASTTIPTPAPEAHKLIAPLWHTIVLLFFLMIPLVLGLILQNRQTPGNEIYASRSAVMWQFYVPTLVAQWLLVWFVWAGLRRRGKTIKELVGGRWNNWRDITVDVSFAVVIWIAMLAISLGLSHLLGPGHAKGISVILPQGPLEMAIWVAISSTAGFVEELIFRGYLQTQFRCFGLPTGLAIVAQALMFALGHVYQGFNAVITIFFFAVLFGVIAAWRKSLRPGMIGHAWFDMAAVFFAS